MLCVILPQERSKIVVPWKLTQNQPHLITSFCYCLTRCHLDTCYCSCVITSSNRQSRGGTVNKQCATYVIWYTQVTDACAQLALQANGPSPICGCTATNSSRLLATIFLHRERSYYSFYSKLIVFSFEFWFSRLTCVIHVQTQSRSCTPCYSRSDRVKSISLWSGVSSRVSRT